MSLASQVGFFLGSLRKSLQGLLNFLAPNPPVYLLHYLFGCMPKITPILQYFYLPSTAQSSDLHMEVSLKWTQNNVHDLRIRTSDVFFYAQCYPEKMSVKWKNVRILLSKHVIQMYSTHNAFLFYIFSKFLLQIYVAKSTAFKLQSVVYFLLQCSE